MLEKIKARLNIPASVTVYDQEITDLIEHAKYDMLEGGVPRSMIDAEPAPVINTIAMFVKIQMADDSKESSRFEKLYEQSVFRLSLMTEEG